MTTTHSWEPYHRTSPLLDALGGLETNHHGKVRLTVQPQHCNSRGGLHGGTFAAYADFVIGHWIEANTDTRLTTTSLNVTYLGTANEGDELIGELTIIKAGKRTAVGRLDLHRHPDRPVATATGHYGSAGRPDQLTDLGS